MNRYKGNCAMHTAAVSECSVLPYDFQNIT